MRQQVKETRVRNIFLQTGRQCSGEHCRRAADSWFLGINISSIRDAVQVVRGADESQVAERLRSVPQLLPADGDLFTKHT
jgi:hypothetical protein